MILLFLFLILVFAAYLSAQFGGGTTLTTVFFFGIIALLIVYAVSHYKKINQERKELYAKQDNYLNKRNVERDLDYKFESDSINSRYIVDNIKKTVYVYNGGDGFNIIPFREVIGSETMIDSEVAGGVGRAVVGGVIAGGAGAVVGAATAKKKIKIFKIIIFRKNLNAPSVDIVLINSETDTDSLDYKNALDFSSKVNASIKAIISTTNDEKEEQLQIQRTGKHIAIEERRENPSAPKYLPGMEPGNIQNLLDSFFGEIEERFPDKRIIWQDWNHARWDKAAGYLCKTLGYKKGKDFLEAYGYTVVQSIDNR